MPPLAIGIFVKLQSHRTFYVSRPIRGIQGFTLIEILIVLLIIGISFSFALLAFGDFGKSRQVQSTAEQFKNIIQFYREQAIIESSNFKINIRKNNYQIARAEGNPEGQLSVSPQLASGTFPKDILLTPAASLIEIHGSGRITPFTLTFGTSSQPRMIKLIGETNGQLKLQPL